MEINLTDLECQRLTADTFKCIAEQPNAPWWFYPVVLACFVMALLILVLVAKMTLAPRYMTDRRVANKYVAHDRRKP